MPGMGNAAHQPILPELRAETDRPPVVDAGLHVAADVENKYFWPCNPHSCFLGKYCFPIVRLAFDEVLRLQIRRKEVSYS